MRFKLSIIFALFFTILCANRLQAQEKAFPKKGEGITLFLKRHNRTGIAYQKQFIELNKNKLGKRNALRMGVKYTLPPLQGKEAVASAVKRANYEPLFGKELASYKVTSSELKGACFYWSADTEALIQEQSDGLAKSSCTKTNMPTTSYSVWHAT